MCETQGGIVSWLRFELDVRVPLGTVIMAPLALELVLEHLLARKGTDCRDLCVTDTELIGVVQHWVDV